MESSHFYILLYISHQPFYATSSTRPLFCVVAVIISLCLEEGNHTVQWAQKNHMTTLEKATEAQKWFLKYSMVFHGIIGKYLTSYKVIGNKLLPVPLLKILDPPNPRKSNRLFLLFQPRALCDPRVVSHFFVLSSGSPRWNFIETNQFSLLAPPSLQRASDMKGKSLCLNYAPIPTTNQPKEVFALLSALNRLGWGFI